MQEKVIKVFKAPQGDGEDLKMSSGRPLVRTVLAKQQCRERLEGEDVEIVLVDNSEDGSDGKGHDILDGRGETRFCADGRMPAHTATGLLQEPHQHICSRQKNVHVLIPRTCDMANRN